MIRATVKQRAARVVGFRAVVVVISVGIVLLLTRDAPAITASKVPVTVAVVGRGQIRLVVADGVSLPCDASSNRVLFAGHATAGDEIKVSAATGSVCVDHTYGSLRESQWAGPSIWSGTNAGWSGARALSGSVSTEEP